MGGSTSKGSTTESQSNLQEHLSKTIRHYRKSIGNRISFRSDAVSDGIVSFAEGDPIEVSSDYRRIKYSGELSQNEECLLQVQPTG